MESGEKVVRAMPRPLGLSLLALAALAVLAVALWNHGPLFYIDTGGYLRQGEMVFRALHLMPAPGAGPGAAAGTAGEAAGIVGSRALAYAILLGLGGWLFGWAASMLPQVLILALALWLILREILPGAGPGEFALPVLAACLGSLPFYAVYLMPDLFAAILVLVAALVTVRAERMEWWALALAFLLLTGSVVMHLSHLGMVALMVPASLALRLAFARRRWWLAPLVLALAGLAGLAERAAFQVAAETVEKREVIYHPFLTARLIADGPGLNHLAATCPETPERAECVLYRALDEEHEIPRRFAPRIIFETDENGSYRLLPEPLQKAIAQGQTRFFLEVARARPFETAWALVLNTLQQARTNGIDQTIPDADTLENIRSFAPGFPPVLAATRVLAEPPPTAAIDRAHEIVYLAALGLVLAGLALRRATWEVRLFVLALGLGILANAAVCGGLSQPAPRYGGRVIFLLPFAAALLWGMRWRDRRPAGLLREQGAGRNGRLPRP